MNILVACEFSGVVRDAFRARGHNAWSVDLLPTEKPGPHIIGDVLKFLSRPMIGGKRCIKCHGVSMGDSCFRCGEKTLDCEWDLMIAHPPCTFILNSGCRHLYKGAKRWNEDGSENPRDGERWRAMEEGARFFKALW